MDNKFLLNGTSVFLGNNSLLSINRFIKSHRFTTIFILTDNNSKKHCLKDLFNQAPLLKNSSVIEIPSGESSKSLQIFQSICSGLIKQNIDRNSLIINLGGGVICDLGGFVASVLKRGIKFINIPTTLMSQIDASIGGKVALNLKQNKNQIGLFSNPELVIVYPRYLQSLSNIDFLAGTAEIFKYGLIHDKYFWEKVSNTAMSKKSDLTDIIAESISIKISIVKSDYYDWENRRKLNFGHSISHAIESVFFSKKKPISHGFALVVGMICATYISQNKFKFSQNILNNIVHKLLSVFPPINLDKRYDSLILKYLTSDKKNNKEIYNFTLIKGIGDSIVNCPVSKKRVVKSLDYYRKHVASNFK